MNNYVEISFEADAIRVEDKGFLFDAISVDALKNPPENKENILDIVWDSTKSYHPLSKGVVNYKGGENVLFDESKYDDWVQPYVDIWQARKDQEDQEQEEAEAERNKFENRQARALVQLNADFETAKKRAHVKSSLGFEVDANQTANENVNGLLVTIGEGEKVQFCDYYNEFHELTRADLETLQTEIIQNAQSLYAQKWQYRTAIEACEDNEGLDAVVATIEFTYMDFTPVDAETSGE